MIIVCPACGRRYRIDRSHLAAGRRLRCSGCRQVFDSRPPAPPSARPQAEGRRELLSRPEAAAMPPNTAAPDSARRPLVLIGDVNRPFRTAAQRMLESIGCQVETTEQGDVLFRAAVTRRPALLLLSTSLPGLSGTAVCEGVKGSPHLKGIKVILVTSTVHPPGARQTTRPGFEPDDQIEDDIGERELGDRLAHLLGRSIDDPVRRPPGPVLQVSTPVPPPPVPDAAPARQVAVSISPAAASVPAAEEPEPFRPAPPKEIDPRDALDPQAEIERLARIMLSDLKLYYPDRFVSAVHDGRLLETFRSELLRGKDLITNRFPDLPDRMALLTAALRQGIEEEQSAAGAN
jgi:predicted Zn finger-like uncharacterized protein